MVLRIITSFLLVFSLHTAAQETSLNGIVLDMYPKGFNKLATNYPLPPVPGMEIKLKSPTFSNYEKTTSTGNFFFGKISDKIAEIEITDPEYLIKDPPAPVQPVWSQNGVKYTMRILEYRPASLKSTAAAFYSSCAATVARKYNKKLYLLQVMYPRPLSQSKEALSDLKQHKLTL